MDLFHYSPEQLDDINIKLNNLFYHRRNIALNEAILDIEEGLWIYNKDEKDGSESGIAYDRGFQDGMKCAIQRLSTMK